ncbi:MAG: glycosyltransferase [Candidatus Hodarchaeota archaeon]
MPSSIDVFPNVTFVIPVHNEERHIRKCINAIFSQEYPKDKILVLIVNDCSTDKTIEKIPPDPRITIYSLPKKAKSKGEVRNSSLRMVKTEYLAFVDADVIISPQWTSTLVSLLERKEGVAAGTIYTPESVWTYATKKLGFKTRLRPMASIGQISTTNSLVRTKSFKAIGGFDEGLVDCEDADLGLRLQKEGPVFCLSEFASIHDDDPGFRTFLSRWYSQGIGASQLFAKYLGTRKPLLYDFLSFYPLVLLIILLVLSEWILPLILVNILLGFGYSAFLAWRVFEMGSRAIILFPVLVILALLACLAYFSGRMVGYGLILTGRISH